MNWCVLPNLGVEPERIGRTLTKEDLKALYTVSCPESRIPFLLAIAQVYKEYMMPHRLVEPWENWKQDVKYGYLESIFCSLLIYGRRGILMENKKLALYTMKTSGSW